MVLATKIFLNFPRPPSASLHLEYSPTFGDAHMMRGSTRLYLPPALTLENLCVPNMALLRFLNGCNYNNHARASTSASCISKTCSCFCPTSPSKEHNPFLYPFFFFLSMLDRWLKLFCVKALLGIKGFSTLALWYHVKIYVRKLKNRTTKSDHPLHRSGSRLFQLVPPMLSLLLNTYCSRQR